MDSEQTNRIKFGPNAADEQPAELNGFLKSIARARRHVSLYGKEHPNCQEALAELKVSVDELLGEQSQVTCVFMPMGVILNDRFYAPSQDSKDVFDRLRHRGVMAVTFIKGSSQEEIDEFLEFLNVDPRAVMAGECASAYLRLRGVTSIVVTETIYSVQDGNEGDGAQLAPAGEIVTDEMTVPTRLSALIEWLINQDDDNELPKISVEEILSHPELSAKLITEAVTKLHASRRQLASGEVANEVIAGLKHLADDQTAKWDENTSQVKKAIARLPEEMRPALGGLNTHQINTRDSSGTAKQQTIDLSDIECLANRALAKGASESDRESIIGSLDVDRLFDAKVEGMLSAWQEELQANSYIRCSGRTFATLMAWESGSAEHARISGALAGLIPRALEIGDIDAACGFAELLCGEILSDNATSWRSTNVNAALQDLENGTLKSLIESALSTNGDRLLATASHFVEVIPSLALEFASVLNEPGMPVFRESLHRGLVGSGRAAIPILGGILREGSPVGNEAALRCLAEIGDTPALNEIIESLDIDNVPLVIEALDVIPSMKCHGRAEGCISFALSHSADIRRAVLVALSRIGGRDALAHLRKVAVRGGAGKTRRDEQITAIEALGDIGEPDFVGDLERLSRMRLLFGRRSFEPVREAAIQAIYAIRNRHEQTDCAKLVGV